MGHDFNPYDSRGPYHNHNYNPGFFPVTCLCSDCDRQRLGGIMDREAQRKHQQSSTARLKQQAVEEARRQLEEEKIRKEAKQQVEDEDRSKKEREKDEKRGKKAREDEEKRKEEREERKERERDRCGRRHYHRDYDRRESKWFERGYSRSGDKYFAVISGTRLRRRSSSLSSYCSRF